MFHLCIFTYIDISIDNIILFMALYTSAFIIITKWMFMIYVITLAISRNGVLLSLLLSVPSEIFRKYSSSSSPNISTSATFYQHWSVFYSHYHVVLLQHCLHQHCVVQLALHCKYLQVIQLQQSCYFMLGLQQQQWVVLDFLVSIY